MKDHPRKLRGTLWLAVAATLLVPSKGAARGRNRSEAGPSPDDSSQRQGRRRGERAPQMIRPIPSPCGRHVAEVIGGTVYIDGRRASRDVAGAFVVSPPTWRRDGDAVAWIERSRGQLRLVVMPALDASAEPMPWELPAVLSADRVFWAGPRRVVVGPGVLAPHAIASWEE
jgi:hypothetical protein